VIYYLSLSLSLSLSVRAHLCKRASTHLQVFVALIFVYFFFLFSLCARKGDVLKKQKETKKLFGDLHSLRRAEKKK